MVLYFLFLFFLSFLAFFSWLSNPKFQKSFLYLFFIFIAVFSGIRGDVGQDTFSYQNIYDAAFFLGEGVFLINYPMEPVFASFIIFHKFIFDNYTGFLVFVSALQSFLLLYASKNLHHRYVFLVFYVFISYITFHFAALRVGIALLFFFCSLSSKRLSVRYFFLILSVLTHLSIFVLFPVFFAKFSKEFFGSSRRALVFIFLALFFFILGFGLFESYLLRKVLSYDLLSFNLSDVSKVATILAIFGFCVIMLGKKISLVVFISFCIFTVSHFLSPLNDIYYRFIQISLPTYFFVVCQNKSFSFGNFSARPVFFHILLVFFLLFYNNWNTMHKEPQVVAASERGREDFTFVPYETFLSSEYRN